MRNIVLPLLLISILAFGCSSAPNKNVVNICDAITANSTDFAKIADIRRNYIHLCDSLNDEKMEMDSAIFQWGKDKNDALKTISNFIIKSPTLFGEWTADYCAEIANADNSEAKTRIIEITDLCTELLANNNGPTSQKEWEESLQRTVEKMPLPTQIKLFTTISSPKALSIALRNDLSVAIKNNNKETIDSVNKAIRMALDWYQSASAEDADLFKETFLNNFDGNNIFVSTNN